MSLYLLLNLYRWYIIEDTYDLKNASSRTKLLNEVFLLRKPLQWVVNQYVFEMEGSEIFYYPKKEIGFSPSVPPFITSP